MHVCFNGRRALLDLAFVESSRARIAVCDRVCISDAFDLRWHAIQVIHVSPGEKLRVEHVRLTAGRVLWLACMRELTSSEARIGVRRDCAVPSIVVRYVLYGNITQQGHASPLRGFSPRFLECTTNCCNRDIGPAVALSLDPGKFRESAVPERPRSFRPAVQCSARLGLSWLRRPVMIRQAITMCCLSA